MSQYIVTVRTDLVVGQEFMQVLCTCVSSMLPTDWMFSFTANCSGSLQSAQKRKADGTPDNRGRPKKKKV